MSISSGRFATAFLAHPYLRRLAIRTFLPKKTAFFKVLGADVFIDTQKESGYYRVAKLRDRSMVFDREVPPLITLMSLVRENSTFIDAGANVGLWSAHFAKLAPVYPDLKVIAFEPNEDTFSRLEQTLKNFGNVTLHKVALSDRVRELEFASGPVSNIFGVTGSRLQFRGSSVKIRAVPLDDYLNDVQEGILKIDVEGHEYEVLLGCRRALEAGVIRAVFIDGFPERREKDILGLLQRCGFRLLNATNLQPYEGGGAAGLLLALAEHGSSREDPARA